MYIAILRTKYEVFAVGETEKEVQQRIVKGYCELYPKHDRVFETPTFENLCEYFGCFVTEIDPQKGYTYE